MQFLASPDSRAFCSRKTTFQCVKSQFLFWLLLNTLVNCTSHLFLFTQSPPEALPSHTTSPISSRSWTLALHNCRRRELDGKRSRVTAGPTPAPVSASSLDTLQAHQMLSKALCFVYPFPYHSQWKPRRAPEVTPPSPSFHTFIDTSSH